MSTVNEIVKGALVLLTVRAAESPVTDAEAQDGMAALNDMLAEWQLQGICIGFEAYEDVQDDVYLDVGTEGPVKANLAVYIAPEYNKAVTAELALRAKNGKNTVRAAGLSLTAPYPDSLPIGSGNEGGNYSNDGDVPGGTGYGHFYPANETDKCN